MVEGTKGLEDSMQTNANYEAVELTAVRRDERSGLHDRDCDGLSDHIGGLTAEQAI